MTDNSLLQDFIVETGEHLEDTERNLLRLEQQSGDAEVLNEIFRSIHTIKGSSEYLGLDRIAELSHKLESLLDLLRRGERDLETRVIDLLIDTNDRIAQLVDDLTQHQEERATIDDLVSRIEGLSGKVEPVSAEEVAAGDTLQGDGNVFEDEYDEELFGIFIDQLVDGLQAICAETGKLQSGEPADTALAHYEDRLGMLRSSANYMGYDQLKEIYTAWSQNIAQAAQRHKNGEPVDWDAFATEVTMNHIAQIKGFFPKAETVQKIELPLTDANAPMADRIPSAKERPDAAAFSFDDIGMELQTDEHQAQKPATDNIQPELALFSDSEDLSADMPEKADNSLLMDFIVETREHLEATERNLLRLEQKPEDAEVLNEIFRSIHTIKGSSEYLGLDRVAELSHKLESLLDLLRRGECDLDGKALDVLIDTNDRIAQLVDDLDQHQAEQASIDDLLQRIDGLSGQLAAVSAEKAVADEVSQKDGTAIDEEYDTELFRIFVDQVIDGLQVLCDETRKLKSDGDADRALAGYEDRLATLRSSANYMGYEHLTQMYDQWSQSVASIDKQLSDGGHIDWHAFSREITETYIEQVKGFFPKVVALAQMEVDLNVPEESTAKKITAEPISGEAEPSGEEDEVIGSALITETDHGLLADFIAESKEHLEESEHNLLELEQSPEDINVLNELFRSIHTIKGSSEYLGMERIAELSHKLENLLDMLRNGQRIADTGIVELLIAANDRIGQLVDDLVRHHSEQTAIDDLITRIDSYGETTVSGEDSAQADMLKSPTIPPEETVAAPSEVIYQEDYDKELFDIFKQHLDNGLNALVAETEKLTSGQQAQTVMTTCKDTLLRLRSSANYMEYSDLTTIYDRWIEKIDALLKRLSDGEQVVLQEWADGVMLVNIDRVRGFFALPAAIAPSQKATEKAPPLDLGDAAETASIDVEEEAFNKASFPMDSLDIDLAQDDLVLSSLDDDSADEQSLLSRLESAFDAKIEAVTNRDFASLPKMDVVKELLSDEDAYEAFTGDTYSGDSPQEQAAGDGVSDAADIESFLFSDGERPKEPRKVLQPKPLATLIEKPEPPLSALEEGERGRNYQLGRRQTDKFRERLLKQSIRVDATKIDSLMNQVGELVVTRAGFSQLFIEMHEMQLMLKQAQRLDTKEMLLVKDLTSRINAATVSLSRITSELQENVMKVRMLPIAQLFSRYPRVVHDLIRNTDKKVDLDIRGEETELDRMVIEQISDPLVHIIRNAVDHGIEPMAERQRNGKIETGILRLEAFHEGNYVVIEVSDDGRGIDTAHIRARALAKGFVAADEAEHMTEEEVLALIMRPGFSTVDEVTHTSGRGVGMDVVKDNIEKLNGTIETESTPGRGTLFRIKIPLTLAIIPALMVRVADEIFTMPLSAVDETLRIHRNEISTIEGMEVYYLRETTLPLIRIAKVFKMPTTSPDPNELFVVVINTGNRQVGLIVDQLKGREEVVIKPLEDYLQEKSGFSGATILGDGSISLILDVADLVNLAIEQHVKKKKIKVG